MPAAADRVLRLLYAEHVQGNVRVRKLVERLAEAEREWQPRASRRLTLERRRSWRAAVRA